MNKARMVEAQEAYRATLDMHTTFEEGALHGFAAGWKALEAYIGNQLSATRCPMCQAPVTIVIEDTGFAVTGPDPGRRTTRHHYIYAPPTLDISERGLLEALLAHDQDHSDWSWDDYRAALRVVKAARAADQSARFADIEARGVLATEEGQRWVADAARATAPTETSDG